MSDTRKASLPKAIFLMGPTASGKTALAIELRKVLPIELISVDSDLIYKGMNYRPRRTDYWIFAIRRKRTPLRIFVAMR